MANYVIYPIPLAEMTIDKSMLTYRRNFGQPYTQITYVWYIEGAREKILVDAGMSVEYMIKERHIPSREIQSLESGLMKVGLKPGDIDLAIITHLHSDHIGQGRELPNARFLVQRAELDFASNPHPTVAGQYPRGFLEGLNFEAIEGDSEVCDGISVISTPGHSPGGQSVAIQTAKGRAIISGLCTIQENFEPPPQVREAMPVSPCGIIVDLFAMYDSLLKIKEMADIIISNHDPRYAQIKHIP